LVRTYSWSWKTDEIKVKLKQIACTRALAQGVSGVDSGDEDDGGVAAALVEEAAAAQRRKAAKSTTADTTQQNQKTAEMVCRRGN